MRFLFVLMILLSVQQSFAGSLIYGNPLTYANPSLTIPDSCNLCVDVYRVTRDVLPLVEHVFVGTQLHVDCQGEVSSSLHVFGANKYNDLEYLERVMNDGLTENLEYVGTSCGDEARAAFADFSVFSLEWREWSHKPWNGIPRFLATPVLGRSCAVAADSLIQRYLVLTEELRGRTWQQP